MEQKSSRSAGMLQRDLLMLGIFLAALLAVNGFILVQAMPLLTEGAGALLIVPFAASMLALAGTLIKVGVHLRKNRDVLYAEESYYKDIAQKRVGRET